MAHVLALPLHMCMPTWKIIRHQENDNNRRNSISGCRRCKEVAAAAVASASTTAATTIPTTTNERSSTVRFGTRHGQQQQRHSVHGNPIHAHTKDSG